MQRLKQAVEEAAQSLPRKKPGPKAKAVAKELVTAIKQMKEQVEEWEKRSLEQLTGFEETNRKAMMRDLTKQADKKLHRLALTVRI